MLDGNRTPATNRCDIELLRTASVRCEAATHLILQMPKRADQHALGTNLRIFEAEFFLVRSQMPALPDWQSISALTDTESFYSD